MKQIFLPLTVLALVAAPMTAQAAACRDAKGRFTTCGKTAAAKPTAAHAAAMHPAARATPAPRATASHAVAKAAPKRCRIGGRFASCSAPGAKPV